MTRFYHRLEVPDEQCAQQCGNVEPVRIGVCQNTNFPVAQIINLAGSGIDTERDGDVVHRLRGQNLGRIHLPGIQDLTPQRHDRLKFPVPCLFRRSPGRIPFHQKQLTCHHVFGGAIGQFPRQCRAGGNFLARDFFAGLEPALRIADT